MTHKLLGKGHDGIIVHPAISNKLKNNTDYITKIGIAKDINNEKLVYDNLPDEFNNVFYNKECYIDKFSLKNTALDNESLERIKMKGNNYDTQLTMKRFNGQNLRVILNKTTTVTKLQIYNLLKKMIFLYECVNKLNNTYNVYHKDITRHNIMFNVKTNEIRIIDFVQGKKYPDKQKPHHLPNKDLSDTIDVINSIIEFITKTKQCSICVTSIKTIDDLKANMSCIKSKLVK
jgi:serine/threonine protein kinase